MLDPKRAAISHGADSVPVLIFGADTCRRVDLENGGAKVRLGSGWMIQPPVSDV
ncbi:hypothetical protein [Roseovarius arcticus]|uniref:hypothetical protein n=1 Tax=Roseovarius arcticus TaxID=2547404 RepID=UPI001BB13EE4|nr:hypothetical protein [Roseovarius arcticus]